MITYWMMVLSLSMMVNGVNIQLGHVYIKNFANQADCQAHLATVTLENFQTTSHTVTAVCQVQP